MSKIDAAAPTTDVQAPRAPRSFSVSLTGGEGATLRITAVRKKAGAATNVVHVTKTADGQRRAVRGATEAHPSLDVARAHVEKLVAQATKLGWKRRNTNAGFRALPDAFDAHHLPAPAPVVAAPVAKGKK
jgi:hypothetical protein